MNLQEGLGDDRWLRKTTNLTQPNQNEIQVWTQIFEQKTLTGLQKREK